MATMKDIDKKEYVTGGTFACAGCNPVWGHRLVTAVLGKNTIFVNPAGCMTLTATVPFTPFKTPWVHGAIENTAAIATGIAKGLEAQGKDKDVYVVPYAGDGATYDIGIQALIGAADRDDNMIFICYNNCNFANTGHQHSSATEYGAWTTTTPTGKKNPIGNVLPRKHMCKILGAMKVKYAATACTGKPFDFMNKLEKCKKIKGFKFIDLLAPCIPGWGIPQNQGYKVGELMVDTGIWPLYEVENGNFKLTYKPNKLKPVKEALTIQKRFKHLQEEEISKIQKQVSKEWEDYTKGNFFQADEY